LGHLGGLGVTVEPFDAPHPTLPVTIAAGGGRNPQIPERKGA